jgi:hypothetical protein
MAREEPDAVPGELLASTGRPLDSSCEISELLRVFAGPPRAYNPPDELLLDRRDRLMNFRQFEGDK